MRFVTAARAALLCLLVAASATAVAPRATAQGTPADYARSAQLNARYDGLALNVVDRANWIGKTDHF